MLTDGEVEALAYYHKRRAMQTDNLGSVVAQTIFEMHFGIRFLAIGIGFLMLLGILTRLVPGITKLSSDWIIGIGMLIVFLVLLWMQYADARRLRAVCDAKLARYLAALRGPHLVWDCRPVHAFKLIVEPEPGGRSQVDSASRFLFDLGGSFLYVPSEALSELLIWGGVDGEPVHPEVQARAARYFPSEDFRFIRWKSNGSPIGFVCGSRVISPASLRVHPDLVRKLGSRVKLIQGSSLEALQASA
ncbi:MAG: hypothetical protein KIS92_03330 [Planctomycetota bacterium]|nr:hypothetical protein [Planctomycetota bacterium]